VGVTGRIRRLLAIDGGGSKTDAVLVDTDGRVLVQARGPSSQPQTHGVKTALRVLDELVERVRVEARLPAGQPLADFAFVYLAGLDLPQEVAVIEPAVRARQWAPTVVLDNDTFAVLRAGTQALDAVAVVCGTGINSVGRNASGGQSRFLALGDVSGDWGGGGDLGKWALWHAARAEDGRGQPTAMRAAIAEHFGQPDVLSLAIAVHLAQIDEARLRELAPLVLATAAAGDEVAGRLVDRLASEIALLATVSMRRLNLLNRPVDVVLGGGVARSRDPRLMSQLRGHLQSANPWTRIVVVDAAPVLGAALLGLDALGATPAACQRVISTLTPAGPSTVLVDPQDRG
jgi:N-acetylglucosamine kinase-like BadF-type ATPase